MNDSENLSHTAWECKYHIVFIPKYRRKALYEKLREHLGPVFRKLAEQKESWACSVSVDTALGNLQRLQVQGFVLARAGVVQRGVDSVSVVEDLYVLENSLASLPARGKSVAVA